MVVQKPNLAPHKRSGPVRPSRYLLRLAIQYSISCHLSHACYPSFVEDFYISNSSYLARLIDHHITFFYLKDGRHHHPFNATIATHVDATSHNKGSIDRGKQKATRRKREGKKANKPTTLGLEPSDVGVIRGGLNKYVKGSRSRTREGIEGGGVIN